MSADKEILSQNEIDSLIHGMDDVFEQNKAPVDEPGIHDKYDLASQDRIVRSRMPTLEIINEKFARYARSTLFNALRTTLDVDIIGVEIMKYMDYMYQLPVPTSINMVKAAPLKGTAMVILDPNLIFKMVDNYYGGIGRHTKIEGREFTAIEQRLIEKVLNAIFKSLRDAWSSVIEFDFAYESMEVNPHMANTIPPSEVMVVSKFTFEIETGKGEVGIAFPYAMLEPIKDILIQGYRNAEEQKDERWLRAFSSDMLNAKMKIDLKMAEKSVNLKEVVDWKAGDIIPIHLDNDFTISANKVPVFKGKMGIHNGNYAFQVKEQINIDHIE